MYLCVWICVCESDVQGSQKCQIPLELGFQTVVSGTEPGSSAGAVGVFNHHIIAPALNEPILCPFFVPGLNYLLSLSFSLRYCNQEVLYYKENNLEVDD